MHEPVVPGQRSNLWTAIETTQVRDGAHYRTVWVCQCDCGVERVLRDIYFLRGFSCGCVRRGHRVLKLGDHIVHAHEHNFRKRVSALPTEKGCLLWTGSINNKGYGYFGIKLDGRHANRPAHRIAWLLDGRELSDVVPLRHRCNVSLCVHPPHLEPGTHLENGADMAMSGRARRHPTLPHGVRRRHKDYAAFFYPEGRATRVGFFATIEEAAEAARKAKENYYLNERGWTPAEL